MKITIINGPNLNLLGKRETSIYGKRSFKEYFKGLAKEYDQVELSYFHSNHEGELIDKLHEIGFSEDGIVFNPGAYTHTSVALADAIAAINTPVIEVHISNIFAREAFRHHSYTAPNCVGSISGLGLRGYALAVDYLLGHQKTN